MSISARTHALRYRVWAYCQPLEWNVTPSEVADALGETVERIRACIQHNPAWHGRMRSLKMTEFDYNADMAAASSAWHTAKDLAAGRIGNGEPI